MISGDMCVAWIWQSSPVSDLDDIMRDMLEAHNHVFNDQRRHRDTLEQIRNLLVACLAALLLVVYLMLRE